MNNTLPPINNHSRSSLEDLHGVNASGTSETPLASKQQHIRRQQSIDQQRRNPMRSSRLIPSNGNKYVTSTSSTAAPIVASPFVSVSSFIRSPSIIQIGSPAQIDSATKTVYRSTDCVWNEHQNNTNASHQHIRSNSPIKNKLAALSQRLSNGTSHENTAAPTGRSMLQIPSPLQQHHPRDDMNNADVLLASPAKPYHAIRRRHTNSFLDKSPGATDYSTSMRKETDRPQYLHHGIRSRQVSSKQRNYVNSKTTYHEINDKDMYASSILDGSNHHINSYANTHRLYDSTLDLATNRKPLSSNKSKSFHVPATGVNQQGHYNSTQDFHINDINNDRMDFSHFDVPRTTSKEQIVPQVKYRRTSGGQTATTTATATTAAYKSGERHASAQTYESRDPNISYAYTNVKKYIEENELMSQEKEQVIRNWINDVEKNRQHFQKIE
ncbi:unnamed protein product [Adineta steineri]|uniref:Uncharacterized protein n=1 Tax=Adineta steineri TaxID=433720 RepID=A0A818FL13_9BILA|nr:unnamed protein product [Adineta steineri]CAF3477364.1 unnamed protein product [Adineta steineri]